ncbi:hypothetical protein NQ315_010071 [Exocentrus adspersus]|uniref:Transforming acidic coiled-coil-containing protein C-terminal domain-containing protein n=1 Tax=Exocentrus adspersus TaxID=1586481 RepID=A0AAV8WB22_9CUCU|nr:hypothetical protein NQ315_010071 [Exocentrus adspersus]
MFTNEPQDATDDTVKQPEPDTAPSTSDDNKENGFSHKKAGSDKQDVGSTSPPKEIKSRLSVLKAFDPLFSTSPEATPVTTSKSDIQQQLVVEESGEAEGSNSPRLVDVSDDDAEYVDASTATEESPRVARITDNARFEEEESFLKFYTPDRVYVARKGSDTEIASTSETNEPTVLTEVAGQSTSINEQALQEDAGLSSRPTEATESGIVCAISKKYSSDGEIPARSRFTISESDIENLTLLRERLNIDSTNLDVRIRHENAADAIETSSLTSVSEIRNVSPERSGVSLDTEPTESASTSGATEQETSEQQRTVDTIQEVSVEKEESSDDSEHSKVTVIDKASTETVVPEQNTTEPSPQEKTEETPKVEEAQPQEKESQDQISELDTEQIRTQFQLFLDPADKRSSQRKLYFVSKFDSSDESEPSNPSNSDSESVESEEEEEPGEAEVINIVETPESNPEENVSETVNQESVEVSEELAETPELKSTEFSEQESKVEATLDSGPQPDLKSEFEEKVELESPGPSKQEPVGDVNVAEGIDQEQLKKLESVKDSEKISDESELESGVGGLDSFSESEPELEHQAHKEKSEPKATQKSALEDQTGDGPGTGSALESDLAEQINQEDSFLKVVESRTSHLEIEEPEKTKEEKEPEQTESEEGLVCLYQSDICKPYPKPRKSDSDSDEEGNPRTSGTSTSGGLSSFDAAKAVDSTAESDKSDNKSSETQSSEQTKDSSVVIDTNDSELVIESKSEETALKDDNIGSEQNDEDRVDENPEFVAQPPAESATANLTDSQKSEQNIRLPFDIESYRTRMADLSEKLSEQQQENSNLKLQLNAIQQAKATLELEIRQKEEVIIKTQAEALKNEQAYKQEVKQLREKLKENSKLIEKDGSKELEEQLKEAKAKEAKAIAELNQRSKDDLNYQKIMEEYENTIATRFADYQKLKEEHETATRHLANIELAFSDVHQKYERTKVLLEGFKSNEEALNAALQESEKICKQHEERYESLKAHAKGQIEKSNKEIITLKEKYETEISKLKAIVKRLEIKCGSLEVSLTQKNQECAALAALCDEVTGKKV